MTLIDRYLARAVIAGSFMVLLVLLALAAFVGVVGEFGRVGEGDYTLADAVIHVLLGLPGQAFDFFPVAALIGSLLGLGALANQNELTVMRAAGVSPWRIARGALFGAGALLVVCVALGEWIAPPAERYADQVRGTALYEDVNLLGRHGAWLRDGKHYVNARHAGVAGYLQGVYIYEFDQDGRLREATHARHAAIEPGGWRLEGVNRIAPDGEIVTAESLEELTWETGIGPELLALVTVSPDALDSRGLLQYIAHLEANELDTARYRLALWFKAVIPTAIPVMVLLAIPFLFGSLRSSGAGQRLLVGLGIGIVFHLVNVTLQNTGAMFALPPVIVAWTPTAMLLAVSIWAIRRI